MRAFVRQNGGSQPLRTSDVPVENMMMHPDDRPAKRVKLGNARHGDDDDSAFESPGESAAPSRRSTSPEKTSVRRTRAKVEIADSEDDAFHDEDDAKGRRGADTALDSALPDLTTDQDAIAEYELMRASQQSAAQSSAPDTAASRLEQRKWVMGRSSIYVDAFNLALDTVLEDEVHLFDAKELKVFEEWRLLTYEAQYLYVRLFLRKAAAWHRTEKLGYYSDISEPEAAIAKLQQLRMLPGADEDRVTTADVDGEIARLPMQDWVLGRSFTFADASEDCITTVEEAARLLTLDELKGLAKEVKVQGTNKADIIKKLCRTSTRQAGLMSMGLRRESTTGSMDSGVNSEDGMEAVDAATSALAVNRNYHFLGKIMAILGPCIRISPSVFKLFERVHLVFYRSTEWTEKSLTTIILAKISKRNFPSYIVDRTSTIFPTRLSLLEFEQAMRLEFAVDSILEFGGPPGEKGNRRVLELFASVSERWRALLRDEGAKEAQGVYEFGEGSYLRRFNAAHTYTRIAHKAAYVHGRLHQYLDEYDLIVEMLDQRLFQLARRGAWYQRKALLEEHYMFGLRPDSRFRDEVQQKKHWKRVAIETCETALEDRDCHLIYHYDLQKRLIKLEKQLKTPKRLQHDFGHVRFNKPEEHTVHGIQLKKRDDRRAGKAGGPSTKTVWIDEHKEEVLDDNDRNEDPTPLTPGIKQCSVEEMCLTHYRSLGWKGYHSEGGIIRTLFAYLFYDILFLYIPNVFQTAYQTCPLDLHTDGFYPARASEINHRLAEIANGGADAIIRRVDAEHRERKTCVVGLKWGFELEDICELAVCFGGEALAVLCKVQAQEFRQRGGGVPDLVLWRRRSAPPMEEGEGGSDGGDDAAGVGNGEMMFGEVKSVNDRLSDTQRLWIHVLTGAGVRVALVNAVAKEVRMVD